MKLTLPLLTLLFSTFLHASPLFTVETVLPPGLSPTDEFYSPPVTEYMEEVEALQLIYPTAWEYVYLLPCCGTPYNQLIIALDPPNPRLVPDSTTHNAPEPPTFILFSIIAGLLFLPKTITKRAV